MRSSTQFIFLNGSNKLVFVGMCGCTFTGLVGPPDPFCLLVALSAFCALLCAQKHSKKKLTKKTKIN